MKTLFLTLRTFSATGGIEKVCRIMGKALYEESIERDGNMQVCSMYDRQEDSFNNKYFPSENFRGYAIRKLHFIKDMVKKGTSSDLIILSHINLLVIGWLIKKLSPSSKVVLLAHGIEIWYPLPERKIKMLQQCDVILAVSSFTQSKLIEVHKLRAEKCRVLNNCLDPFLPLPSVNQKNEALLRKYGFTPEDKILMILTRLSSKERYKGYDKIIEAIAVLREDFPGIKYLIAGSYDTKEKEFVDAQVSELGLCDNVLMPGYIADAELEDHFQVSDMYVMPSRKEGFGIVFIEAMYYGLPVIAGNIDGSVDALLNGALGQLVDPDDVREISNAIRKVLIKKSDFIPDRTLLLKNFSYEVYKQKLEEVLC